MSNSGNNKEDSANGNTRPCRIFHKSIRDSRLCPFCQELIVEGVAYDDLITNRTENAKVDSIPVEETAFFIAVTESVQSSREAGDGPE
jgi:hypothetical protein